MATIYRYVNNSSGDGGSSGSVCDNCIAWDGVEGLAEELAEAPNPDCLNPDSCNCTWEEIGDDGEDLDCADDELECVDSEGFGFCGEEGDEGCGDEGCWCTEGLDPEDGEEIECESPYWDPNCICASECGDRDDAGD